MWWNLFFTFLKIGAVSFGGGYAMIPIIDYEVQKHSWLTPQQFTDVIAIAGMSPGPIATNSVIFVGYKTAGLVGAILSTIAISLPSLLLVLLVALVFYKVQNHPYFHSAFYILRPIITGLIAFAAIKFAINNGIISSPIDISGIFMMLAALAALLFTKIHPVLVIILSGVIGIWAYY